MTYLTLGQLNMPIAWLAFLLAIFYSDFRSRKADVKTNKILERFVFTYLVVWKLSYLLFSWSDFVKAPLSLIYFDGGIKGHLLALGTLAVVLYRKRHVMVWPEVWIYWARLVAMYGVFSTVFQEQWFIASVWLVTLVLVERKYQQWMLLVQFLLLASLSGFTGSLTLAHLVVLLTLYAKTKQAQYVAVVGVFSLVAMLLGDIEQTTDRTVRGTIDLPTTTGEPYRLAEQHQQLTVVNFFATWCPPCKAEMPHLQSFAQQLPSGVELIGVNLTERDHGREALRHFMKTYEVSYPILLDETDEVGTAFQVMSIPTTVLLNAQGEEVERIIGPISEEGLRQLVKKYQ